MSFKHRSGKSWQSSKIKKREAGTWVTISGSSASVGPVPERFYTDGPPERSGETITYDGTNYSSLQAAHDDLTAGDTLYIDPVNSPYTERLRITKSHITIKSDGKLSFDSKGRPTVDQQGAVLEQPDTNNNRVLGMDNNPNHPQDAELVGSYDGGGADGANESVIKVTDASPFSVGDEIHITEWRAPFGYSEGADTTSEYRRVENVDNSTDELTLNHPLFMPYPNSADTDVGIMNWNVEDVLVTGVFLRGDGGNNTNSKPMQLRGAKQSWVDNMVVEDAGGSHSFVNSFCFQNTIKNVMFKNPYRYGLNVSHSSSHTYITDIAINGRGGDGASRYGVRFGSGGGDSRCCADGLVQRVYGTNLNNRRVTNVHHGGFYVDFENIVAENDAVVTRLRSRHINIYDFEELSGTGRTIQHRQRPHTCEVTDGTINNKQDGFVFDLIINENDNEKATNLTYRNIEIGAYNNSLTEKSGIEQIGRFNSNGALIEGTLRFTDVYYDGQKLTESDVQNWENYDVATIENLVVE